MQSHACTPRSQTEFRVSVRRHNFKDGASWESLKGHYFAAMDKVHKVRRDVYKVVNKGT